MRHGWLALIAMLLWGTTSFAAYSSERDEARQQIHTISSWMAHLNFYYPNLAAEAKADLNDPQARKEILWQLERLESALQLADQLPPHSLTKIACSRPACDGGGAGNCSTCADGR